MRPRRLRVGRAAPYAFRAWISDFSTQKGREENPRFPGKSGRGRPRRWRRAGPEAGFLPFLRLCPRALEPVPGRASRGWSGQRDAGSPSERLGPAAPGRSVGRSAPGPAGSEWEGEERLVGPAGSAPSPALYAPGAQGTAQPRPGPHPAPRTPRRGPHSAATRSVSGRGGSWAAGRGRGGGGAPGGGF